MNWFLAAITMKYATFTGRARRKEYWFFILFYTLAYVALTVVDRLFGLYSKELGIGAFSGLFALALVVPSLAVLVRRLHDIGRSGWWVLFGLIPLLGPIVLLVFCVLDSEPLTNDYGPNPKGTQVSI